MNNLLYAEIAKTEQQPDGTVKVFGYASSPSEDSDGEIVTPAAIEAALPDYMKFGAVREMHQPKAAGTAIEAKVTEDGRTWFGAHVVDKEAVKKVQSKVYKGFSIGGKVLTRDPDNTSIITGIKLVEVSLVDRPANPDAVFTMYKAEDPDKPKHDQSELSSIDELSSLVNKGAIVPSKLVELAKAFINGELAMADEPSQEVNKTFWDVAELAHLLGCLKSLQTSAAFEAAFEGDESEIPNRLKQNVKDLTETLIAMIGEEAAELTEGEVAMSDTKTDVNKAEGDHGDKNPKDHGEDAAAGKKPEKAEDGGDLEEKEDKEEQPDKKSADADDLTKGDDILTKFAGVLNKALDPIVKRLEHLEGQPAPAKGALKTIGKADDVGKADNADEDGPPAGSSPEEAALWEIKKAHRAGGLIG